MTHARLTNSLRALPGLLVALLVAMLALTPLQAQQSGGTNIRVSLVADGPPVAGHTWTVALHFTPSSKEWHGYWSNPGDAGAGMRLAWDLPPGWQAGEPLYPVPKRLEIAGLMNHVFEGDYAVLVPIAIPAQAVSQAGLVAVEIDYLACTEQICVPERAKLSLVPSAAVRDARFDRWRAALAPLLDQPARYEVGGKALRIAIPLPASVDLPDPHVFVQNRELVNYAAPQSFARDGDTLVAELPLGDGAAAPERFDGILSFGGGNGLRFTGRPGPVPTGGKPLKAAPSSAAPTFWIALIGAFLGGLILNVMPCVFPILSLKALALARAGGEESAARRDALAYTGGVVIACLALGGAMLALRAGGEQVGWAFQLQQPGVVVALLALAVAITANFIGVFEVPSLAFSGRGGSGGGSFLTGLLAAFVATPCTGPFMAAALGAALLLPAPQALTLFGALGLGLALPFLLLGFVPALRRWLPRPGGWMKTFQRWMSVPMGLTALALAWLAWRLGGPAYMAGALGLALLLTLFLHLVWGAHRARSAPRAAALAGIVIAAVALTIVFPRFYAPPSAQDEAGLLGAQAFSEPALAKARTGGKPVFVYFTADWCLTCKVNEGAALERASTRDAFEKAGVTVLRGDWTRRDEAITRFLAAQGAAGVPLYLWYPAGQAAPRQLPQVLTSALLAELASGSAR